MAVAVAVLFSWPEPAYRGLRALMILATMLSAGDYVWIGNKRLGAIE